MARVKYDWEAIEKDYRAGMLSIREVAKIHGCTDGAVRKKAKLFGWERNLEEKIKSKVRAELVRAEVRSLDKITEKEVVEQAAATQVEIVRGHRSSIKKASGIVNKLLNKMNVMSNNIADETAMQKNANTAVSLSNAMKNLIGLERQAFGISGEVNPDGQDKDNKWTVEFINADTQNK